MKPLKNPTKGLKNIIITSIFILKKFHQKEKLNIKKMIEMIFKVFSC
jgi:hypothetical protein